MLAFSVQKKATIPITEIQKREFGTAKDTAECSPVGKEESPVVKEEGKTTVTWSFHTHRHQITANLSFSLFTLNLSILQ